MARAASRDEIVALETEYWDAMKRKDGQGTSRLSAETALTISARGVSKIPKARMGKMTEEGDWELHSYAFDDVEVVTPAPDVAIIAYTVNQRVTMKGKTQDVKAAESSTWIRGANGWECHAHSESFLQDAKA